jgi:hypothetical protein
VVLAAQVTAAVGAVVVGVVATTVAASAAGATAAGAASGPGALAIIGQVQVLSAPSPSQIAQSHSKR